MDVRHHLDVTGQEDAVTVPATATRRTATWDDYTKLGDGVRAEYIDGCIVMTPSPTREHQVACGQFLRLLEPVLPDGYGVVAGWAWKPDANEFIPDVMVHPATSESVRFTGTPALAVEVLSTNRGDDLVTKLNRYAAAGLPHYWILDPANRVMLAYAGTEGIYDLVTVVDEHQPREVDFGIASATVDMRSLLA